MDTFIRITHLALILILSSKGAAMDVHPYDKDLPYQKGVVIPFTDFTVILEKVETDEFLVAGINRQRTTESFRVTLPDGNIIKRSVSNGFPGGIDPGFGFRATRDRFFKVEIQNGRMTASAVDSIYEPGNKPGKFARYVKTSLNKTVNAELDVIYVYPEFDLQVLAIKEIKSVRTLSPNEIDQWFESSKTAIESSALYTKETRRVALESLFAGKDQLRKKPQIDQVTHTFDVEVRIGPNRKMYSLPAHEVRNTSVMLGKTHYLMKTTPPSDGLQNRSIGVSIEKN
jgi:hypothetical protein